jgi:N-acyl-D-aspartate/D-glutamate deacylase
MDLMASMSLAANRPLNWNVLGVNAQNPDGHRQQLSASDYAADRGARVVALTVPDNMRFRLSLLTGFILDALPGWRETMALPPAEKMKVLSDPEARKRLNEGASSEAAGPLRGMSNWKALTIAETFAPENDGYSGRTVGEVAAERGQDPFDALCDIAVADELRTGLLPRLGTDDDATWKMRVEVWRDPRAVLGASDAGAHLDMIDSFTYTTALLGQSVRDRQLLPLEEAVQMLTDVPARLYGLRGRGRIEAGSHADLVVLDEVRVGPGPIYTKYDLPAGAGRLYGEADGIEHVLVNGVEIARAGTITGERPGTLLRSGRDTDTVEVPGGTTRN